jgi:hypothetical protein
MPETRLTNITGPAEVKLTPEGQKVIAELTAESEAILAGANDLVIRNDQDYANAGTNLVNIKKVYDLVDEKRRGITRPIDAVKKYVIGLFATPQTNTETARFIIDKKMRAWEQEKQRAADEARRKAEKEAAAEAARLQARADKAAANGKPEKAAALEAQAVAAQTTIPEIKAEVPKVEGLRARRMTWKAEVVDIETFLSAPENKAYTIPNQKMLDDFAKDTKGKVLKPGVRFYEVEGNL